MKALVILASVLLVVAAMGFAFADNQQTVTASVTVPGAISITANPLGFTDTAAGGSDTKNLTFSVTSNKAFAATTTIVAFLQLKLISCTLISVGMKMPRSNSASRSLSASSRL